MAFLPMAAAIVGGGAKVLGGIMDTNSQVGQYKAQGAVERENQRRLGLESSNAYQVGVANESQQRREGRAVLGDMAAGSAEGALSMSGSLLDIVRQSETRANLDALKVRYDGVSRGQALANESAQAGMRSQLAKSMAKRARVAGIIGTAGDLASAGASVYGAGKAGGYWGKA